MGGTRQAEVEEYKYLDIIVSTHSNWQPHIQYLSKKLSYSCYTLLKATKHFPPDALKYIYYTIFHSNVSYCIETWGLTYDSYLLPTIQLQKRVTRVITNSHHTQSATHLFHLLNVLPFRLIKKLHIALLVHNIIRNNIPFQATYFFRGSRYTRHTQLLLQPVVLS